MGWLNMRDFLTLDVRDTENKKYLFECKDSKSPTGHSLSIRAEATHAGIVNGNARFYRPDRMQDCSHTWVPAGKPERPVLVNHDRKGECIGRIHKQRYVDLSYKYSADNPNVKSLCFYDSVSPKKLNLFKSVDWVMSNLNNRPDYKGLGFIELGMDITDPDAIQKIQDRRFLTVSVSFATDAAICSICHTDWAVDDRCEHELGQDYEGKPCFLVSGNFVYKECSMVNMPADPWGVITGADSIKQLADSVENRIFFMGLSRAEQQKRFLLSGQTDLQDSISFLGSDIQLADSIEVKVYEDSAMDLKAIQDEIRSNDLTKERALALRTELDAVTDKASVRRLLSTLNAKIRAKGWNDSTGPSKAEAEVKIASLDAVLPTLSPDARVVYLRQVQDAAETFGLTLPEVDLDAIEDAKPWWEDYVIPEEDKAFFEPGEDKLYEQLMEGEAADKVLSSEARKKLKSSTFCGPGRSFPVPDCAHVTAARRLIGRAKVSDGTKSKILSCVSRKAKALGCTASEKKDAEQAPTTPAPAPVDMKWLSDLVASEITDAKADAKIDGKQAVEVLETLHKFYKTVPDDDQYLFRGAVSAMLEHWYSGSNLQYYKNRLAEKGSDAVIAKSELDELHAAIEQYEKDIEAATQDKSALITTNQQILKDQKQLLARVLVTGNVLLGKSGFSGLSSDEIQKEITERAGRKLNSLQDSLTDLLKELPGATLQVASDVTPSAGAVREVSDSAKVDTDSGPAAKTEQPKSEPVVTTQVTDSVDRQILVATKLLGPREASRRAAAARFQARKSK